MNDDNQSKFNILKFFMEYYGSYHDHKETMAWAATAFYIGGMAYLTNALHSLACHSCSWQIAFTVLFLLAGILALSFVVWQFRRRKEAAKKAQDCYDQLIATQRDFPSSDPETKRRWLSTRAADPHATECLSVIAIIAVTIIAVVLLNICTF